MSFQVSDKVVCVDDSPSTANNHWRGRDLPILKGEVYVIQAVWECVKPRGVVVCDLVGIASDTNPNGRPIGFRISRFRKLTEIQAENVAKRKAKAPKEAVKA